MATPSSRRWTCSSPRSADGWARSRGNSNRHLMPSAFTATSSVARRTMDDGEGGTPSGGLNDEASSLVRLREVIRLRHYAKSTEKTYLHWKRRFLAYHRETSTEGEPSAADAKAFLTHLAMVEKVSASTQNQAFNALLLLFREVLRSDLDEITQTVRAKRGPKAATAAGRAQHTTTGSAATPSIFVPPPRSADSMICPSGSRRWRFPRRRFSPMGPATRWRTLTTQIRVNAKLKVYH